MKSKDYLDNFLAELTVKINAFESQWRGTRFAAVEESALDPEDDEENEYEEMLQKYRGKNGNIKPLGLILFNKFVRSLFILFLALTLLFVPVGIVYSFGGGLSQFKTTSSFSRSMLIFSIASLPRYRLDDLSEADLSTIDFHRYLTLTTDAIAVVVILSYVLYLKIVLTKITNQYMAKSPAPNLYCLEVENVEGQKEEQILQHFSKLARVAQLSPVYTYRDIIYDLRKVVKLATHLCHLKPDMQEYEKTVLKIENKYKELAQCYLKMPKPSLKSVFICFQQISSRNRVYDLYKYEINPEKLDFAEVSHMPSPNSGQSPQSIASSHKQDGISQQVLQKHHGSRVRPVVKKCNYEPLTINWQNCDIDKCSQNMKSCCQLFLLVILAFVILLGLFLLNINSSHIRETSTGEGSEASGLEQAFLGSNVAREKYTFCASLTISDFKWEYYDMCADYIEFEKNRFALMLAFALMVAVINMLTNRILWALVAFRRYRTLAERNNFLITSIFCFSLLNSAILILLVRGHYTGPILRRIVGSVLNLPQDQMVVTVYSEFNRNWYMNIGAQLMMNYIVSLVFFPNFHILLHWVRTKYRQIRARHANKEAKKPVFNYCTFYALSLKSIFFALMYSNSMPVFYSLCCVALGMQILLGKCLLSKFVDEPVFVDNNAIHVATDLIPYSLLLHCLTSILFLNVEEIFPTPSSYENIHNNWLETNLLKLQRGFLYVLLFLTISVYICNRDRIDHMVIRYWLGRSQSKAECDQTKKFKDIKSNPAFLASYKMRDNPKYKILYYALQLFCSHMERVKARKLGCKLDDWSLDISSMFTEEETMQKVHRGSETLKNCSSLKNVNVSEHDQEDGTKSNWEESEVQSVVWVEDNQQEQQNRETGGFRQTAQGI